MTLGNKIRELRLAKGLTQSDLGSGLVTPSMISQIEGDKANPSYKVMESIAKKLETPLEYFLADIQTQLEVKSIHKLGRALLSAGKYEHAIEALLSLSSRNSPLVDPIELNLDLGECHAHLGSYAEAAALFEQCLQMSDQGGNQYGALQALNQLGLVEEQQHHYHSAVFYWRSAYQRFAQLKVSEPFIQSQILINLGTIHQELGDFEKALSYLHEAHAMICNSKDHKQVGTVYLELGIGYEKSRDFPRAIEYSQYASAIFESIKHTKLAIDTKVRYGMLTGEVGDLAEAYKILEGGVREYEKHQFHIDAAGVRGKIAVFYFMENRLNEAKGLCKEALSTVTDDHMEKATLLQLLGRVEDSLGNYDVAVNYLEKAKYLSNRHGALQEEANTLSMLGQLHQSQGNFTKANECLQEMKQVCDRLLHERGIIK